MHKCCVAVSRPCNEKHEAITFLPSCLQSTDLSRRDCLLLSTFPHHYKRNDIATCSCAESRPKMKSTLKLAMVAAVTAGKENPANASSSIVLTTSSVTAGTTEDLTPNDPLQKRSFYKDDYKIFTRKRNAHACIMSIVFVVLFPLGAISMHGPLRGIRVTTRIHLPIQLLGLAMMIGALGLGIDIANVDLNYFAKTSSTKAHVVIGLLTCCVLLLFQPALGLAQHVYFKRTGKKSVFAHIHRWTGRVAICLGWINSGLGFQLVPIILVKTSTLVRQFVLMGLLGGLWFGLIWWDGYRRYLAKKDGLGAYRIGWERGVVLRRQRAAEEGNKNDVKLESGSSENQGAVAGDRRMQVD